MTMRGLGQFLNALGAAGDEIGKGELGGNMDRLHRHCSWPQDLHHLHRWGDGLCLRFSVAHLCLLGMLSWRPDYSFRYGTSFQRREGASVDYSVAPRAYSVGRRQRLYFCVMEAT